MLQEIIGKTRRAIEDFNMIEDGDKILVGLSGGKDSLTLLNVLNILQKFHHKKFTIMAVTIDPGDENFKTDKLEKMCKDLDIEYVIYKSNISEVIFNIRKEKSPCSLCANMRRGMLNSLASEYGCTKIALGHHADDLMETFLMSILLNGKIHTFAPVTHLSRSNITTIRPFIYVDEKKIRIAAKQNAYPVMEKYCPLDGYTKRDYISELIKTIKKDIPSVRSHILGAIKRSDIKGWNKDKLEETLLNHIDN